MNAKKTLISLSVVGLLFGGGVAVTDPTVRETADFALNGKYTQYKLGELKDNLEVHEYVSPKGAGYQVYETETRSDGKYVRSYGSGEDSEVKSFDWKLMEKAKVATST